MLNHDALTLALVSSLSIVATCIGIENLFWYSQAIDSAVIEIQYHLTW